MPSEYITVRFPTDADGLHRRMLYSAQMGERGWRIVSESIEQGHLKGGQACCLATICLPMGFMAGRTPGIVTLTLARELDPNEPKQLVERGQPFSEGFDARPADDAHQVTSGQRLGRELDFILPIAVLLVIGFVVVQLVRAFAFQN